MLLCCCHFQDATKNDSYCWVCHDGGDVLCCDKCPRVFHIQCSGLSRAPEGDEEWYCPVCKVSVCGSSKVCVFTHLCMYVCQFVCVCVFCVSGSMSIYAQYTTLCACISGGACLHVLFLLVYVYYMRNNVYCLVFHRTLLARPSVLGLLISRTSCSLLSTG